MRLISVNPRPVPNTSPQNCLNFPRQEGFALLMAVVGLSIFSLIGLYCSMGATTEVRISENHESRIQADLAARAGLNHARALIRGLQYNDLLRGPDGVASSTYPSTESGQYAFRNWVDWSAARTLNILDPTSAVGGLPDDGLFNTGKFGATNGTVLVPASGVALTAPNPYGSGTVTTARYFVKVTDNPEDCDGDPFTDCDDIIIVRSTGVARTILEAGGGTVRANSVAVYEARFKQSKTFELSAPVVLQGDQIEPAKPNMFNGNSFNIEGGANAYGIGVIDTNTSNGNDPEAQVEANLDKNQYDNIEGSCCSSKDPAIGDITSSLSGDQLLLLDPSYLWNFAYNVIPAFADGVYQGNQHWSGGGAPNLGSYDLSKPANDPSQHPRVTYVNGDLSLSGNMSGAGVLLVTGDLSGSGSFDWVGIILVIGKGSASLAGMNVGLDGGLYVVNLQAGSPPTFGTSQFTISGNSDIRANDAALHLGIGNLPPVEIGWRELTSSLDP